ncbi:DeoR family transcriptional regulator [Pontibaca methylaminivorans]|uniref:DeoR family transcriptional regulator n=1 Tax=Pontibaca methylaminivorans TaxID=515897 RepID=UPI002FD89FDA
MWSQERRRRILAMLEGSGQVSTQNLADLLEVSRETIRRDLLDLEGEGLARRVHGGAVRPEERPEAPFRQRVGTQRRALREFARKAVSLV